MCLCSSHTGLYTSADMQQDELPQTHFNNCIVPFLFFTLSSLVDSAEHIENLKVVSQELLCFTKIPFFSPIPWNLGFSLILSWMNIFKTNWCNLTVSGVSCLPETWTPSLPVGSCSKHWWYLCTVETLGSKCSEPPLELHRHMDRGRYARWRPCAKM